jgi:pyridoxal phosphate enzyme (YggS family)
MESLVLQIGQNLNAVRAKIADAAISVCRDPAGVKLVVVSKSQPVEIIRAAYAAGARCFGENYPQEAEEKIIGLRDLPDIEWHMIGHLQSRKASIVASHFHQIHSIDSLSLAVKLNRILEQQGKILPALLEINVGGEESKAGWQVDSARNKNAFLLDLDQVIRLPNLKICGLMTMPPLFDQPELSRPGFQSLRHLRDDLVQQYPAISWKELSMGTSTDFEVAVQEGATMVRVGRAVLGPRPSRLPVSSNQ